MGPEKFIINGLQNLYSEEISDVEINDASENLLGFIKLLVEIDKEQNLLPK